MARNRDLLPQTEDKGVTKSEKKILMVLAHYEGGRSKEFVAAHAGYSVNTGHYNNILSALRSRNLINATDKGGINITGEGRDVLGPVDPLPSGDELLEQWMSRLHKGEKAVLEAFIRSPACDSLTKDQLGTATGYSPNTGHFNNCLSKLRSLNLIEGSNPIRLAPEFAEAIGA